MAGGGFCIEMSEGPKNRGLVERPGSVLQGCAEDARVRGGCGRRVVTACHGRRTSKRSGWAGTGRQMRGRRWSGILRQNLKKCPCQNKYIDLLVLLDLFFPPNKSTFSPIVAGLPFAREFQPPATARRHTALALIRAVWLAVPLEALGLEAIRSDFHWLHS